jgi:predicted GH43/DUF377 family glycosyl hydrolase
VLKNIYSRGTFVIVAIFSLVSFVYSIRTYTVAKKNYKSFSKYILNNKSTDETFLKVDKQAKFQELSYSCGNDFVVGVRTIDLGLNNAYNASMVADGSGYRLFFRQDTWLPFKTVRSSILTAYIDENFKLSKKVKNLTPHLKSPEDPRVFTSAEGIYCIFNDLIDDGACNRPDDVSNSRQRMYLAKFDEKKEVFENIQDLNFSNQKVEKNWSPFSEGIQSSIIKLVYSITPQIIYEIDLKKRILQAFFTPKDSYLNFQNSWVPYFGKPCGGATVVDLENEYLNIFHSSVRERQTGVSWYLMGAYTFEKEPPYRLKAYTKNPIYFEDIYSSKTTNPHGNNKKIIYPAGVVRKFENGRHVLHVSCGENDSAIKIVTIDEDKFLSSMVKVVSG